MIEINLIPGARKAKRSRSAAIDFRAILGDFGSRIRDPWLITAMVGVTLGLGSVGFMFWRTSAKGSALLEEEQRAVQDSTRYASVLKEHDKAEAKRDTVLRSLNLIRAIDDDRYIWPHVIDEVSKALPPYTWLVSLGFTGLGQAQQPVSTVAPAAPTDSAAAAGKKKRKTLNTIIPRDSIHIRIVGNTVDIQALTRFMRILESSPFVQNVTLNKSNVMLVDAREVTEFTLDVQYQKPDPAAVTTVPITLSVR